MTDEPAAASHGPDGLWRWLLGGLAGGALILGLLIAAYAIGYHRGQHRATAARHASPPPSRRRQRPRRDNADTQRWARFTVTPALVARGKALYTSRRLLRLPLPQRHSWSRARASKVSPAARVTLTNGQTVTADDAYLERSIADPDAQIVKGYHQGIMSAAIASFDLDAKPDDIRALVAFIKSQK